MPDTLRRRKEAAWNLLDVVGTPIGQTIAGGINYLLQDQYTTDRAAGAVNGTLAEPTGQARTVTDTNSKLSISAGVLTFATGGVGAGDPGLWYPAMTTVLGTILKGEITPGSTSPAGSIGWDTAAAGIIQDALSLITGSVLQAIAAGTGVSVGTFTNGSTYSLIIIPRANGFWFFIKGGSQYPFFTLVWMNATGAAGSWLPAVGVSTGTVGVFTTDNIRIPVDLYIPQPLVYDTFTRADGALGSTEVAGPDSQVIPALTWNFTTGIWTISTNKAIATPTPGTDVIVNGGFGADTDWTKGAGWTIAAGVASGVTTTDTLTQTVAPLTVGKWYQIKYTISGFVTGLVQAKVGNKALPSHGSNSTFTEYAWADTTAFLMAAASSFTGNLDNISAKTMAIAELFSSVLVSTADVIADVNVTLASGTSGARPGGLVLNLDSTSNPQNYVLCYLDGIGRVVLDECVAGVMANKLTPTAITYSAGATLRVIRDGTACRVFYNGAAVSTVQTMTANVNKNHGLFLPDPTNSLDNFTLWARGTGGEYATLDNY